MILIQKIITILLALVGIGFIIFGVRFLLATEFLPWQAGALDVKNWADLPSDNYRILLINMIHVIGGAQTMAGALIVTSAWSTWTHRSRCLSIGAVTLSLLFVLPISYATYTVANTTPGNPPLTILILGIIVISTSIVLSLLQAKDGAVEK